jgi:hypothetical protein
MTELEGTWMEAVEAYFEARLSRDRGKLWKTSVRIEDSVLGMESGTCRVQAAALLTTQLRESITGRPINHSTARVDHRMPY